MNKKHEKRQRRAVALVDMIQTERAALAARVSSGFNVKGDGGRFKKLTAEIDETLDKAGLADATSDDFDQLRGGADDGQG